jgi:hypothetical protein
MGPLRGAGDPGETGRGLSRQLPRPELQAHRELRGADRGARRGVALLRRADARSSSRCAPAQVSAEPISWHVPPIRARRSRPLHGRRAPVLQGRSPAPASARPDGRVRDSTRPAPLPRRIRNQSAAASLAPASSHHPHVFGRREPALRTTSEHPLPCLRRPPGMNSESPGRDRRSLTEGEASAPAGIGGALLPRTTSAASMAVTCPAEGSLPYAASAWRGGQPVLGVV